MADAHRLPPTKAPADSVAQDRLKILYIVGWGHSGSTLLDLVISSSPRVCSVGELIFFDFFRDGTGHRSLVSGLRCTCREFFTTCPFWSTVMEETAVHRPSILYDDDRNSARLRWLLLYLLWRLGWLRDPTGRTSLGDDARLLDAVRRVAPSRAEYIFDSSKDFARLIRLLMNDRIEVYPIHLVRDGRAVAFSYNNAGRAKYGLKKTGYYKALVLWIAINFVSRLIVRLSGRPWFSVSYDTFCKDPRSTIQLFNQRLGLAISENDFLTHVNHATHHGLGGNTMRFRTIKIHYDESWRSALSKTQFVAGTMLVGLFNFLWVRRKRT